MMKYQAIIVSDLHLGTKDSKAEEFIEFIEWLGNQQRIKVEKTTY